MTLRPPSVLDHVFFCFLEIENQLISNRVYTYFRIDAQLQCYSMHVYKSIKTRC